MATETELFRSPEAPVGRLAAWVGATIDADATLAQVCQKLAAVEVGALPVVRDDTVVGLVSERDVVQAIGHGAFTESTTAGDVASLGVRWVTPDTTCATAMRVMLDHGIRHLGVGGPEAPSLLSARDLLRALAPSS